MAPAGGGTFVSSKYFPLGRRSRCLLPNVKESGKEDDGNYDTDEEMEVDTDYSVSVAMQFEQLTRELEVKVYKGLPSTETLRFYSII